MAYSTTIISATVGEKSLGKQAPNRPDDVKKVQSLLRKVFGYTDPSLLQSLLRKVFGSTTPSLTDGVCDDAMKRAIADFQKLWGGKADSTVAPNSQTLRQLDRLTNPLTL